MYKLVVFICILFFISGGVFVADKLISRPDRIGYEYELEVFLLVRDQILKYEYEKGVLPKTLDELTPRYLRKENLSVDGQPLYIYDSENRTLESSTTFTIHGLWDREWDRFKIDLPLPDKKLNENSEATLKPVVVEEVDIVKSTPVVVPESLPKPNVILKTTASNEEVTSNVSIIIQTTSAEKVSQIVQTTKPTLLTEVIKKVPEVEQVVNEPKVEIESTTSNTVKVESQFLLPDGPELKEAMKGALVIEAEHYTDMNYGWEVHADPESAGGAYIHTKEGTGNGPAQTQGRVYNYYNIKEKTKLDFSYLKYHFNIKESGRYRVYARMFTTGVHCSNNINFGVDRGGPVTNEKGHFRGYWGRDLENKTPFRWLWTRLAGPPVRLKKGDHFFHLFIHEDGIKIDQFALIRGDIPKHAEPMQANYKTLYDTEFEKNNKKPVHLNFDSKSWVFDEENPPDIHLTIRRQKASWREGHARVWLEGAAVGGGNLLVADAEIENADQELYWLPLDFSKCDYSNLPRKEFLLKATFQSKEGEEVSAHIPMMHAFSWKVAGPYPYYRNGREGPLDGAKEGEGPEIWKPIGSKFMDHYGVLDFGLFTVGNSLHAPEMKTIYIKTKIFVPQTAEYLFKFQSDDQSIIYIDGEAKLMNHASAPVTRSARRQKITLQEGVHDLKMRINQGRKMRHYRDGRWQASLRIRTAEDEVSDVVGLLQD